MHIPDGFLSPPVWAALDITAMPALAIAARKARAEIDDSRIPLLGTLGAFVFAAQMVNFPVGFGTSAHLVGGALLVYALGPATASIVMTAILGIQALVFQDGGLLALGANVLNMAVAGVLAAWLPLALFQTPRRRMVPVFTGAVLSVVVSGFLAVSELLLSGVAIATSVLALSLALFIAAALIEGIITVAVIRAIERLQPSWVRDIPPRSSPALGAVAVAAIVLASAGVIVATAAPDGIQQLAQKTGIASRETAAISSPLRDYMLPAVGSAALGRAAAGLIGVILIFAVCVLIGRRVARGRGAAAGGGV
jgi:cobalt/nickel transport system permease protein